MNEEITKILEKLVDIEVDVAIRFEAITMLLKRHSDDDDFRLTAVYAKGQYDGIKLMLDKIQKITNEYYDLVDNADEKEVEKVES